MDKITKSNNAQKSTTMDKITKSDNARSHTMDEWPHPTKSRQKYTIQDQILWIKSLNPNRSRQNYNANSKTMDKLTISNNFFIRNPVFFTLTLQHTRQNY